MFKQMRGEEEKEKHKNWFIFHVCSDTEEGEKRQAKTKHLCIYYYSLSRACVVVNSFILCRVLYACKDRVLFFICSFSVH